MLLVHNEQTLVLFLVVLILQWSQWCIKSMRSKVSFMGWMICWCAWPSLLPLLEVQIPMLGRGSVPANGQQGCC